MTTTTWKDLLTPTMPVDWAHDIDIFEGQIALRKAGKIDDKVFAETRLRQGIYGQRYDNGQRHDGVAAQQLAFPTDLTKGPETLWDAPGMQRIKVPFGGLNIAQMEVLAELADEYSDGILHVTTRQDFQLHYVHIEDTPDLMRRLAAVGLTTLEACGNSVRNVTACPLSGVCHHEVFDVTPYSKALAFYLLGHDDVQDFGRKVKIAFSGCEQHACGLVRMHDLGLLARTQEIDGETVRGFTVFVGGGLGTIPHQAKVLREFAREEEILPLAQAVSRVFARYGEKKNRNRARIKFLVAQLGIEEFRRLVDEEFENLPHDERWTEYLTDLPDYAETPLHSATELDPTTQSAEFQAWYASNVYNQRQAGYSVVTINLPLGDLSARQMFQLADIAGQYTGDNIRTTVEQNIVLRWIPNGLLPELFADLQAAGLAEKGAGTIVDITTCPGTDTCKLGIASSRGLASELRTRLAAQNASQNEAVKDLRIKVSGCFNSCGQHHIADIGFFGNSRRVGNRKVPHFQVVLGGTGSDNAGSYGLAIGAVPSKRIPDVLDTITRLYTQDRQRGENFQAWVNRLGKKAIHELLTPFMDVPAYELDPSFYSDWGDARVYTIDDIGIGECAGEVVSVFSMEIAKAESEHLEALIALDDADYEAADEHAYQAMLIAARALIRTRYFDVVNTPDEIVQSFRTRFYETELFYDPYAKGKFARYLLGRHEKPPVEVNVDIAQAQVGEAQLFIEACHTVEAKLNGLKII